MAERQISGWLRQVLELGPTVAFFILYLRIRDETYSFGGVDYSGFIVATIVFVPLLLVAMAILWALTGKLSRMQIFTAFMVIFFGGLTAYLNDEKFFKIKTTVVYAFIAGLLGIGLLRGRSYLQYVMGELLPMREEGWMILTKRIALTFVALALANELVWRTQSEARWVVIETFVFPIVLVIAVMTQFALLQDYMIEDAEDGEG